MQTLELDADSIHDLAKLMHLAAEQCKWKLYSLASTGMRRTNDGKTVENALAAALYWEGVFRDMGRKEKDENAKEKQERGAQ